jgi:outer membrane protein assembly factor BamD (BamD/ComL family)
MRKKIICGFAMFFALAIATPMVHGQGGVKAGPDPSTIRDPDLEKDSLHNLEVARNYFKLKKAYVAALKRCEEIIAGNPNFAKIEEVLLIAGESSLALADGKGKQAPTLYVTYDSGGKRTLKSEEFREMGREYLTRLITDYPESRFRQQAEADLQAVGGPQQTKQQP